MQDITKDSRYQHLKDRVAEKWDSIQSSSKSTADKEKEIATFAVKNMHDLFGNYDKLISRLRGKLLAGTKLSHSEQEYFDQNHKKNAPLSKHPRGSFRSAQYNHVLSMHLLKDVANIDSTVISAAATNSRNRVQKHGRLTLTFFNNHDNVISPKNVKRLIASVAPQTREKILSKESDIIQRMHKGKPSHKYHIHPVLNTQEVALSMMANGLKKQRQNIKKATRKDPLPAVRNAILDHVISSQTQHHSPSDVKYLKFMFENEQPFFEKLEAKKVKNHEAFNKENIAETHAADGSSFKNTASLSKMKKSFPLSEQDIHNDKKFQKLSHAFQEKNKALENSILPLHQKRKIASEFTTVAHDIVRKDPRYKSFQKALTKKLDELTRHIPYNHNLKGDIRNFSQQKFKEIFGEDTPFHLATITQPFAPSDISSINESSKTYVNAVSTSRYDTIIKPNKKLIADDGYYSTKRQGITNISQDPRAQKLITNIKSQWQKFKKSHYQTLKKKRKFLIMLLKKHIIFSEIMTN